MQLQHETFPIWTQTIQRCTAYTNTKCTCGHAPTGTYLTKLSNQTDVDLSTFWAQIEKQTNRCEMLETTACTNPNIRGSPLAILCTRIIQNCYPLVQLSLVVHIHYHPLQKSNLTQFAFFPFLTQIPLENFIYCAFGNKMCTQVRHLILDSISRLSRL